MPRFHHYITQIYHRIGDYYVAAIAIYRLLCILFAIMRLRKFTSQLKVQIAYTNSSNRNYPQFFLHVCYLHTNLYPSTYYFIYASCVGIQNYKSVELESTTPKLRASDGCIKFWPGWLNWFASKSSYAHSWWLVDNQKYQEYDLFLL